MRTLTMLAVGLALTVMAAPAFGQGTPADETAIRKATDQFPPAWTKGDAKALAALYSADADYVSSTGLTAKRACGDREGVRRSVFRRLQGHVAEEHDHQHSFLEARRGDRQRHV
jgi:ketosteroid isomerase-like protein